MSTPEGEITKITWRSEAMERSRAAIRDRNHMYARVFGSPDGRAVLEHMESESYMDRTTLARPTEGRAVDPLQTSYNEGMRAWVLRIRSYVAASAKPDPEIQQQAHSQSVENQA